jgi:Ice-binding-like
MNRFDNFTKPLMWFMALLLAAFVAGCGSNSSSSPAQSSTKALTAFSFNGYTAYPGLITAPSGLTPGRVAVILPNGTNVTTLVAKFATTGQIVTVGGVTQGSGITPNDFTTPVSYNVTAGDGTQATYNVTVSIAPANAKALTAFSLAASGVPGTASGNINETAKTIAVVVPFGTPLTSLIATFTTTGASVTVAGALQESGTTPNNFPASPGFLAYTVHAADTTTAVYNVTVTVAQDFHKDLTAYSLNGVSGVITAPSGATPGTVAVTLPFGTSTPLTGLIATFSDTGAGVTVAGAPQTSGTTPNDFPASPGFLAYMVHAADTTTAVYNVTVTVSTTAPLAAVNLLTAGDFAILANTQITCGASCAGVTGRVTGDVGQNSLSMIQGSGFTITVDASNDFATAVEVVGKLYAQDYTGGPVGSTKATPAKMTLAGTDMIKAYNDAAGRTAGKGTFLNPGASGDIAGLTLVPGVYTFGSNVTSSGAVTLSGGPTDVWIIQISGYFRPGNSSNMILSNPSGGALPLAKNIFWAVAGSDATLGTSAHLEGVILTGNGFITLNGGSTVNGRLLAQTAVTLHGTVTQPAP